MKKKLSKKEEGEVVTKGYLQEYIDSKNFVTKDYLDKTLESKNYVTKDWALEMFESFEKRITEELKQDFRNHTGALMEFHAHQNKLIIDALLSRIERVERHVGLPSF
jgi:hypothetical protein